jgi:hypothetical protein
MYEKDKWTAIVKDPQVTKNHLRLLMHQVRGELEKGQSGQNKGRQNL